MGIPPVRLLDKVRQRIRLKGYSIRTEKSYVSWIKRFVPFHDKRHPQNMIYTHVLNRGGLGVRSPIDTL